MSNPKIKVSQMSVALSMTPTDYFMLIQNGINKKVSLSTMLKNVNSTDNIRFNPVQNSLDFSVASKNDAYVFYVKGSVDKVGFGTNAPESKVHVNGNLQVGSTGVDGILLQSSESITYTTTDQTNIVVKPISPVRAGTIINCDVGVNGLFSMPNGANGQIKTIFINTIDSGRTASISITGLGFNTITSGTIGNSITLQFFTSISKWCVVSNYGVTLSTI